MFFSRCDIFEEFEGLDEISLEDVMEFWDVEPHHAADAFKMVDQNSDLSLQWTEVYEADVVELVQQYPFVLPGIMDEMEEEEMGEGEGEEEEGGKDEL